MPSSFNLEMANLMLWYVNCCKTIQLWKTQHYVVVKKCFHTLSKRKSSQQYFSNFQDEITRIIYDQFLGVSINKFFIPGKSRSLGIYWTNTTSNIEQLVIFCNLLFGIDILIKGDLCTCPGVPALGHAVVIRVHVNVWLVWVIVKSKLSIYLQRENLSRQ